MVQPGQVLADRVPSGATDITMTTPDGQTQAVAAGNDGTIAFGPLTRAGVYELSWTGLAGPTDELSEGQGRAKRVYAANLADAEESDLAASENLDLASTEVAASRNASAVADVKLWPWLILFALLFVMVEWFIYNRKVYV
jgi:Flp pilus assembly protein TadG